MNNPWGPPGGGNPQGYVQPQGYAPAPQQGGYGPAPGAQPLAPQGYAQAPMQQPAWGSPMGAGGPASVMGVPLAAGERVIYFFKPNYKTTKIALIVIGVLTIWAIVGIILIVLGVYHEKWNPRAHIVTNQRVMEISGKGVPSWIPLSDAFDVEAQRQNSGGGAGLVGVAVIAIANSMSNNKQKTDPSYWKRTIGLTVLGRSGQRWKTKIEQSEAMSLGPFLAGILMQPGAADHATPAAYEP